MATTKIVANYIDNDIEGISWSYRANEGFKISDGKVKLVASPIYDDSQALSPGNSLIWSVRNASKSIDEDPHAEIEVKDDVYYLNPMSEGKVIVTCSNAKGNVSKSFNANIYENGTIIINPLGGVSQSNIDPYLYYGEYDLRGGVKKTSYAEFSFDVLPEEDASSPLVTCLTDNIVYDDARFNFLASGEAKFSVSVPNLESEIYSFKIVEEGINVYSYADLLYCTNLSSEGEVAVLRKNLLSFKEIYETDDNSKIVYEDGLPKLLNSDDDSSLFGEIKNYDRNSNKIDFSGDVYRFKTTYNHEFIDQWNARSIDGYGSYQKTNDEIIAGIHIKKDLYGNGFTVNANDLTYPSDTLSGRATPSEYDLFKGPLTYITLGDPNKSSPLIEAFGQDNISFYVDGDGVTIDDVRFKGASNTNDLNNYNYVGTVVDVSGDDITIKNAVISNGKTGLRVFSSKNFLLDNSYIYNAREFNMKIGSNEFIKPTGEEMISIDNAMQSQYSGTLDDFVFNKDANLEASRADFYTQMMLFYGYRDVSDGALSLSDLKAALKKLGEALNDVEMKEEDHVTNIEVKDTYFGYSGLFSIAFDNLFNGPYLYGDVPSMISSVLKSYIPLSPYKIGGVSYPSKLKLSGATRFYDYKDLSSESTFDASCLIEENVSSFLNASGYDYDIGIDDFFPLKSMYIDESSKKGYVYKKGSGESAKSYLSSPIAFYGGSLNLSSIDGSELDDASKLGDIFSIDLLANALDSPIEVSDDDLSSLIALIMERCVPLATGFEPFKFLTYRGDGYLEGDAPKVDDLINRAEEDD
jgi:hypothetical protein